MVTVCRRLLILLKMTEIKHYRNLINFRVKVQYHANGNIKVRKHDILTLRSKN